MQVQFLKASDQEELRAFVESHPQGSIEQTWAWGELQSTIPGRDEFFVLALREGEKLVASMLLIRQETGRGKTWLWCPGGPLLPKHDFKPAWRHLRRAVHVFARKGGDMFLRIESRMPEAPDLKLGRAVKESYLPRNTLLLDINRTEDTLLEQMKQKGRYNIKQAHKKGVYVKKESADALDDFYDLLEETAVRDGFCLHEKGFYKSFMEYLEGESHLYLAYQDHDVVGGLLATHFGDTATYYFGASSSLKRGSFAPYALQWFAIQEAKKAGIHWYDFLGIAPMDDKKHPLVGVTQFKTRFGGKRMTYDSARMIVYRPIWTLIYKLVKCVPRLRRP